MTDLHTKLKEVLANRDGVVSVSVIPCIGSKPESLWTPASSSDPIFLAYSITKTFIAALALRLCEEGRLNINSPLSNWFPRITQSKEISIRHLLNHTGGIPDYGAIRLYHDSVSATPSTPWSFERFAAETFDKGLSFEPGKGWAYSNPGYMLVKRIIEEVAGDSFRDLIFELIARPLKLDATFVPESVDDLAPLAPGTSRALSTDRAPKDVRQHYHPGWVSHGVVASTPSDTVRFIDALFRGDILSKESLDQMTALVPVPGVPPDKYIRKPSYGLGLMGDPDSPWGLSLGHNGGGPCYNTSVFHATGIGGATVCAMGALEENFQAQNLVFEILDYLGSKSITEQP